MIIKDLLNYFNHASKTIKNIHEFKARLHYEDELRNYTIIGNKLDRKPHLTVVLPIGEDESGNTVILTTNLTSKKEIKFNEEVKVTLEREYELKHNGKLIPKSYESPVIKETLTEGDKKLIKTTGYDKDDIRTIINNSCYPDITFNEISFPNNKETVLVEKLDKNIQLKKIEKGSVLIDVLKKEGGKEILKWNPYVDKYIESTKLISDRLTYNELKIIENVEVIKKASERGFIAEPMENNKGYIFTHKKAYVSGEENKILNEKFYNLACKTDSILKKY